MIFDKIKTLAQVIGFATIAFLALNGGLAMLNGDLAWGATLSGIIAPASAQAPQGAPMLAVDSTTTPPYINYQGNLRDAEGNLLSGHYTMTFRIYDDLAAPVGAELWSEDHISVTVRSGHFSVLLGNTEPISPTLFTDPDRFIGVTVDPYDEMVPRQRFASVPYAITADHVSSLNAPDDDPQDAVFVDNDGNVGIGTTSPRSVLHVAGSIYPDAETMLFRGNNSLGTPSGDGFRLRYDADFFGTYQDALVIEKTDGNQDDPDGGVAFVNTGADGVEQAAMVIRGGGNVGIGNWSPSEKLEVAGDGKFTGGDISVWYGDKAITIRQDGNNSYISNKENFVDNGAASNGWLILNGSNGVILQYGDSGSSGVDGLTLDSSGNVGVGIGGEAPILIKRFRNRGNDADFSTEVSANDYHCVATGWSTHYDFKEDGSGVNMVWTYVSGSWWRARVQFHSGSGSNENPDVDIVCFRKEIAEWGGPGSRTMNDPD